MSETGKLIDILSPGGTGIESFDVEVWLGIPAFLPAWLVDTGAEDDRIIESKIICPDKGRSCEV